LRIVSILLACCGFLAAQTNAPSEAWPLEHIAIDGIHNYTREQVLGIAKLKVGQVGSKVLLDEAHSRLMTSGVFDSVAYRYAPAKDGKGVDVTFEVVEVNAFYPILFEDLPVKDADLRVWLKQQDPLFGPKISATKESLAHYTELIGKYLGEHGFQEPVTARLSSENPPDLVILIRPSTQRPTVASVTAVNTGEIVAGVVQSTLYGVAVGSVFSEARVRQLLDSSVRPLYDARGRVRVSFPKITGVPATDVKGIDVTVEVDEGPVFEFGKVKFRGGSTAEDELANLAKIKSGTLANFDEAKAAQSRIADHFRHEGYLRARTEIVREIHDKEKTVDVTFQTDPGPLYTFKTLTIVGLDIISEPPIRKLWGLQEGKPFVPEYPDHFVERVKEMGLFDDLKSVSAERKIDQDRHTVDVTVTFVGGREPAKRKRPGER
jgi:outer membrane protein assembly factor BamA